MNRVADAIPWLYAVGAIAIVAVAVATGSLPEPVWRGAIVVGGAAAVLAVWRANRLPKVFAAAVVVAALRLASVSGAHLVYDVDGLAWHHAIADLLLAGVLVGILGVAIVRRSGRFGSRDVIDVLAAGIGAAVVGWLLVGNPLIERHDVEPTLAVAASACVPMAVLLLTFTIDLLVGGLTRNRSMQFVVLAAAAYVAATILSRMLLIGELPDVRPLVLGTETAAFLLLCAGLVHAHAPAAMEPRSPRESSETDRVGRLALMAASVMVPAATIASMAPTSQADRVVRTVGTIMLVIAVVVRLFLAMRDHGRARRFLIHQLSRDELTNLPNRASFLELVGDVLEMTWRTGRQPTIIQLNLDRFKNINDSLGRYDANRVLTVVSRRLDRAASSFGGTAARVGGDDFAVIDGSTSSTTDALQRVDAIRAALAESITIGEATIFVTASIGVAVAPRNRTVVAEELMRRADIATHRAKSDGRNRVAVFDESMQAHLARRMDVEHALHGAIERQEMRLYHQPIVDIITGRVSGFEALIRWQRSDDQLMPPADFVPIAEETGTICEIGAWAILDALRHLRSWIDDAVVPSNTTMSVNVSPRQIADPEFAAVVREAIDAACVPAHLLWLEMTESMMLEEPEVAEATLRDIRAMGVRLALDDFGTGFSSLSLLQRFPIQRIKIDRAFVHGIAERTNDRSLVRTIIAMGQSMGLDLVAEGVETVHQLQGLRELGCDKAQGFLISHPVPTEALRSTMVALDQLAELPLFRTSTCDATPPAPAIRDADPETRMAVAPIRSAAGGPLGGPIV